MCALDKHPVEGIELSLIRVHHHIVAQQLMCAALHAHQREISEERTERRRRETGCGRERGRGEGRERKGGRDRTRVHMQNEKPTMTETNNIGRISKS